jgi:hypothetical protein
MIAKIIDQFLPDYAAIGELPALADDVISPVNIERLTNNQLRRT